MRTEGSGGNLHSSLRRPWLAAAAVSLGVMTGTAVGAGAASAGPGPQPTPPPTAPSLSSLLGHLLGQPAPPPVPAPVPPVPVPVPTPPAPAGLTPGTPCTTMARACFSVSADQAWLIHNGTVTAAVPALGARKGYAVPEGTFSVTSKDLDHVSSLYDAEMPYSVFFHDGSAFHEGSLTTESHGCIHLSHDAAVQFYDDLQVGDRVEVVA